MDESLTVESLAQAIVETRIQAITMVHGEDRIESKRTDGTKYLVRNWNETGEHDKHLARVQARLLMQRMMR